MGYSTYFKGKMEIELKEPHLTILNEYVFKHLNDNASVIIEENHLMVDDEWKNNGLMEEIVLFIEKNGKLNSGSIMCNGEDLKDVWELYVADNGRPAMREHGEMMTLNRLETTEWFKQVS